MNKPQEMIHLLDGRIEMLKNVLYARSMGDGFNQSMMYALTNLEALREDYRKIMERADGSC